MWSSKGWSIFQGMQGKTRSHKPELELGLEKITCRKRLVKISEVVEKVEVRIKSCLNVGFIASLFLESLEVDIQLEEEATPSQLSGKT